MDAPRRACAVPAGAALSPWHRRAAHAAPCPTTTKRHALTPPLGATEMRSGTTMAAVRPWEPCWYRASRQASWDGGKLSSGSAQAHLCHRSLPRWTASPLCLPLRAGAGSAASISRRTWPCNSKSGWGPPSGARSGGASEQVGKLDVPRQSGAALRAARSPSATVCRSTGSPFSWWTTSGRRGPLCCGVHRRCARRVPSRCACSRSSVRPDENGRREAPVRHTTRGERGYFRAFLTASSSWPFLTSASS